jgi:glutaminyl-tRNA synthetase
MLHVESVSLSILSLIRKMLICRPGVNLTEEDIATLVESYLSSNVVAGWSAVTSVLGTLKTTTNLRWANPLAVKTAVEHAFTEKFGTKESAKGKAKVSDFSFYITP